MRRNWKKNLYSCNAHHLRIYLVDTNPNNIRFSFSEADEALFDEQQRLHLKSIEENYVELKKYILPEIEIIQSGTHKEWIRARMNSYITTSLMRLLYLTESFTGASTSFNAVTSAVHVKAMVEIPLHLAYLVWIVSEHHTFEEIRTELAKISWGNRNPETGLTQSANITQRQFYEKADLMVQMIFKDSADTINLFETIYKEANATGHHNYEGRNVLVGVQNKDVWKMKDRKEWFVFISKNIFQFFLQVNTILFMSKVFVDAINHYVDQLPDYFPDKKQ